MSATDVLAELLEAVRREQAGPADVSSWDSLLGEWSYIGDGAQTLPPSAATAHGVGEVASYGSTFVVTVDMLRNSINRFGVSEFAEALSSEDRQIELYGEVRYKRGEWRWGLKTKVGSVAHEMAAQDARTAAAALRDPEQRREAMAAVRAKFGDAYFGAAGRSRTLSTDATHRAEVERLSQPGA